MVVYRVSVHLAADEWSSDQEYQIMENLAKEQLAKHADKQTDDSTVIVTVHEHAGWWLSYAALGNGSVAVVGTANDQAQFSDAVRAWGAKWREAKSEYLESIRR